MNAIFILAGVGGAGLVNVPIAQPIIPATIIATITITINPRVLTAIENTPPYEELCCSD